MNKVSFAVLLVIIALLSACQNIRPAQRPLLKLDQAHIFGATRLAFSKDSLMVASGGFEGGVKLWRVPDGKLIHVFKKHKKPIRGLVWLNQNNLASISADGELNLWHVPQRKLLRSWRGTKMTSLAYNHQSGNLILGFKNGLLKSLDPETLNTVAVYDAGSAITSIAVNPKNAMFAIATKNKNVFLFSAQLENPIKLPSKHRKIYELRFSPDGKLLAASTWFTMLVWDLGHKTLSLIKTEHRGAIVSFDFSPDSRQIISLGRHTDANIRLMDVNTATVERRLAAHEYCGWHIRFSPNGRYVASASEDESIRFYDIKIPYKPTWNQN